MSAETYLDVEYVCPFCGSDNIDPYHNMGSVRGFDGEKYCLDHYKCRDCGERGWEGLTLWDDDQS